MMENCAAPAALLRLLSRCSAPSQLLLRTCADYLEREKLKLEYA
jgi:hypothetical protein